MKRNKITALSFIAISAYVLLACRKDDVGRFEETNTRFRVKEIFHVANSGIKDTTIITYKGDVLYIQTIQSDGTTSERTYTKNKGHYTLRYLTNNTLTYTGYDRLSSQGLIDSSTMIRTDGSINNISLYTYNDKRFPVTVSTDYITYKNILHYVYKGNNIDYILYDVIRTNGMDNKRDSIVVTASDISNLISLDTYLGDFKGQLPQNLEKSRTYYNRSSKSAYQVYTYSYKIDGNGLVIEKVWNIYTLPDNGLVNTDTLRYTYYTFN